MKISVKDTGCGISEQGLKKLFIDFSKLDENSKRNAQGTGLGLSICKNIIEQMGGSVNVQSKVNEGTEFIINMNCLC
jgi:signal transduction histidine kinase